ncbi:MAG: RNA-binding S4 domain-containing protein [Clostridia bacterium]|nr:RNA-binding S4 domain-containing protein [Clostridia bacterium]
MKEIKISTPFIKLDQFLKFAGISFDGAEAKEMIKQGLVTVNGEAELRRGRKLYEDDEVKVDLGDEVFELIVK